MTFRLRVPSPSWDSRNASLHRWQFFVRLGSAVPALTGGRPSQVIEFAERGSRAYPLRNPAFGGHLLGQEVVLELHSSPALPEVTMTKVSILSIDGGGIRGIIPAILLAEIEKRTGKQAHELFDYIAGTSTGGLLALALARPDRPEGSAARFSASDLLSLYLNHGREIFSSPFLWKLKTLFGLAGPKYDGRALARVLREYLGDYKLHNALTGVLVTAYDTEAPAPIFFKSWRAHPGNEYDFLMAQVALATAAAPTYFPAIRLPALTPSATAMCLVDGGVFAANPGMCALADAHHRLPSADPYVVSLGTGDSERPIPFKQVHSWGLIGWASNVLDVIFDGVSDTVDYELTELVPTLHSGTHKRLQPKLPARLAGMDDARPANVAALVELANRFIAEQTTTLDQISKDLVAAIPFRTMHSSARARNEIS